MSIACEVWLNAPEKAVGKFEFDAAPRVGETVSLAAGEDGRFIHYTVEHVTHRAHSDSESCATYLFVAAGDKTR